MKVRAIDEFPELAEVPAKPVTATIRRRIDEIWDREREGNPGLLYDGQLLSYQEERGGRLVCTFVPYRRFVAQVREPELYTVLQIRPVAVSGVLRCRDGIVLGKRSEGLFGAPGKWEFAPSGGIDAQARVGARRVSAQTQLYHELEEELQILPRSVRTIRPLAIADDAESNLIELIFTIEADIRAADLGQSHLNDRREYETVRCVYPDGIAEAVTALGDKMLPLGHALLPILASAKAPPAPSAPRQWGFPVRSSAPHVDAEPRPSDAAPVHHPVESIARSQG